MAMQDPAPPTLPEREIAALDRAVHGEVIRPGHAAYETARRVWNGMIDRHPAAIVRCVDVDDVKAGIRVARELGLAVTARGGGHSVAGFGTVEGGVVLDLSPMRAFALDPIQQTATIGGGHTWGSFDSAASPSGLHTTGGLVSTTGVAGLTLGGGIGWLMRRYGLAADNLLAAEVVTADGRLLRVDATEHPELLWGLRGGGGNFGIVTSMTFALHPVTTVFAGMALFPAEQGRAVLHAFAELCGAAPDELAALAALMTAPPAPFVPPGLQGRPAVAVVACHLGPIAEAERALAPLRRLGPSADLFGAMPYVGLQSMLDATAPAGQRHYWTSAYFRELDGALIDQLLDLAARKPVPFAQLHLQQTGGAVARVPAETAAVGHRDAAFALNIIGTWEGAERDEAGVAWVRGASAAVEPWTDGAYVNFLSTADTAMVRAAYGHALPRLAELKRQYDPAEVFRVNHKVRPA